MPRGQFRFTAFRWGSSKPADMARELLRRTAEIGEKLVARAPMTPPCILCIDRGLKGRDAKIVRDQAYMRGGKGSKQMAHNECIWASLPPNEAAVLSTAYTAGILKEEMSRRPVETRIAVLDRHNGNGKPEIVLPPSMSPLDADPELMSTAEANHRMGFLEGQNAAQKEMIDKITSLWQTTWGTLPEVLKAVGSKAAL